MKELTMEEKAKRYDEAYKKVAARFGSNVADEIFLKESEDESIRKALIKYYSFDKDGGSHALDNITPKQIVTWLEKQGEQKPVFEMKTPEESLGIDSDTYNKIVDECVYGEQKPDWSEEDKDFMYDTLSNLTELKDRYGEGYGNVGKCIDWLKSLKERYIWKPSKE